jgi:putative transposase
MTRLEDRQILVHDIEQARADGARLAPACALAGIDAGTLRRWKVGDGLRQGDRRPDADRPIPSHALSDAERARIIEIANEPRFAETPPARIVPALADEGIYIASESSFHRVLRAHGQMNRRGRAQPPRTSRPPTTHIATRPGDAWCWDVTFLPAQIQGRWFYFTAARSSASRCMTRTVLSTLLTWPGERPAPWHTHHQSEIRIARHLRRRHSGIVDRRNHYGI